MKLLALDTSTEALSVSLAWGDSQVDRYVELERGHSEQLLPLVESVLAEAGMSLTQLDAIAFGRGPGGFTGVRLAASVTQGLAFGAGVGVVPVSSLQAVAQRIASESPGVSEVLVVNDARMREVYWARFAVVAGVAESLSEERVNAPGLVAVMPGGGAWAAAGRGLRAWPELAARCLAAGAQTYPEVLPRAQEILALARARVQRGDVQDPEQALPVYVRDRVAEPSAP